MATHYQPLITVIILASFVALGINQHSKASLNTASIVTATTQAIPHCLRWRLKGFCYWLHCSWTGCRIHKTLKVRHFIPDAVVTVFTQKGKNPWQEARLLYDQYAMQIAQQTAQAATGFSLGFGQQSGDSQPGHDSLTHAEVNVIGHPVLPLFGRGVLHQPTTKPWRPYFQSLVDVISWRKKPESFDGRSWIPGRYAVGQFPRYTWGVVYPRHGQIDQPHRAKAAAVIALRAADIVARRRGLHIARMLGFDCGAQCQAARFKVNHDEVTWQMLYPEKASRCQVLGQEKLTAQGQHYAWNLWRRYEGCIQGKGKFLWSVDF